MPQAYKVLKDSKLNPEAKAGTIVYRQSGHDYGLSSDDTRATGVEHISVTLKRSGGYPGFTIPRRDLEETTVPDLPKLTDSHVMEVCRPGEKDETCRYLTMGAGGWSCEKHSALTYVLDSKVRAGTIVARGNNCEGRL